MMLALNPQLDAWLATTECPFLFDAIERERELVRTPEHLVEQVVGETEFAWDFRCLDAGFHELVAPFWRIPSGVQPLLLQAMELAGAPPEQATDAAVLVEFVHMGVVINDHYSCHPDLACATVDRRKAHALTQLRYAGQFLTVYPRYLLARNRFGLDQTRQIWLHKLVSDMAITQSVGRGLQIKWAMRGFRDIQPEWYRQHCINSLANYVSFPLLLAFVLGGHTRETIESIKPVAGRLAEVIRLGMEHAVLQQRKPLTAHAEAERGCVAMLTFPGAALTDGVVPPIDATPRDGFRFPLMIDQFNQAVQEIPDTGTARIGTALQEALQQFQAAGASLESAVPGIGAWAENLSTHLALPGGASHA